MRLTILPTNSLEAQLMLEDELQQKAAKTNDYTKGSGFPGEKAARV